MLIRLPLSYRHCSGKKREKKGELDPLLTSEFAQMPELDLQLTHIWPQNPDLAVLLGQRSIQRRHRTKLPSLAKTFFGPRGEGFPRNKHEPKMSSK